MCSTYNEINMKKIFLFCASFVFLFSASSALAAEWTVLSVGNANSFRAITQSGDYLIAAGNGGVIFRSSDSGKTWVKYFDAPNVTFFDFATLPDGQLIVVGSDGINEVSSDHGATWSPFNLGVTKNVYGIDIKTVSGASTGYMVGANGIFRNYANATENWETRSLGVSTDLFGVEDRGDTTAWVVGADGKIFKLYYGGTSYSEVTSGTYETLYAVRFVSKTKGFIVGTMGTVLKTVDGGTTWNLVSIPGLSTQKLYSLDVSGNKVVIVGDQILITSEDAGETWSVKTFEGNTKKFFGALIDGASKTFAVGSDDDAVSLVYQFVDAPAPVSPPATPAPVTGTAPQSSLIKLACSSTAGVNDPCKAVYYYATDGKRHAFTNDKVFFTWFNDFSSVKEVSAEFMASLTLGKNVTYRPGVKMVKFQTSPIVYAVAKGGVLRPISSESVARSLYGVTWNQQIDDISDVFYGNYTFGEPIVNSADYNPAEAFASVESLSENF